MERAVFVFGGQGPEWWGMGRELFAQEPAFAEAMRACDHALAIASQGASILRQLEVPESESQLGDVAVLQPFLFAVHAGIDALLRSWGVEPVAVIGHSFGELSAAYAARAISLEDAMRVLVDRTRVMKRLADTGRMAVVETGEERARRAIAGFEDRLAVGVINSPQSVVLSGEQGPLAEALKALAAEGIRHREIRMPYPVHGPQMHAVMDEVTALLAPVCPLPPAIPLYSTVTGGEACDVDARYWARNIGGPARFGEAIDALLARGWSTFVEIGPHPTLGGAIAQCAAQRGVDALVLPSLRRQKPERTTLRETVDALSRGRPSSALAARLRASSPVAARTLLTTHVRTLLAHRLEVEPEAVSTSAGYGELGLDSASAVELAASLAHELALHLPATLLFEHPTIDATVSCLLAELGVVAPLARRRERTSGDAGEPIAIVGIGCRFPGSVDGPDSFWRLLEAGTDAVTEVPASRWDSARLFDPDPNAAGKTYSKWGGFLDARHDGRTFDAAFFGISPREAQTMDPQQRILLEVAWEAFEHAGIAPPTLTGSRTGVFVGICTADYSTRALYADPRDLDAYSFTGNSPSVAAGRLSYVLGLEGPALVVDTACSSSLVALHLACRSLRSGESDLVLAGGVNLIVSPTLHIYFSRLRALSPTGRSRAFDASADGYVRGEGCGLVVLKRLSDARADGDHILALVRGTAVNQDGRSSGLTAPNGLAQQAVVREALREAGVTPAQVGYVEAHGTGTPLGDPIELRALGTVLAEGRPVDRPFVVGSVKTNIGHTEGAAGIAGVIKATLALGHGRIPRSLHFREPNPHIQWADVPARVAAEAVAWESDGPRIAGISSFGFSGTNAHVVLEEPPSGTRGEAASTTVPVLLSGRTEETLRAQAAQLREHVERQPELPLPDLAVTLATGRTHFDRRAAFVAGDRAALARNLAAIADGHIEASRAAGALAVLFTGQGSQRVGMGRMLYERFPAFREAFDAVLSHLDPSLREVMWGDAPRLDETGFAQPTLFALEVALFRLFEAWGVRPAFLAGHSVGEIAAAHVAGVLSLEDACTLVTARGRLMQALPAGGAMISVEATPEEVRPVIAEYAQEIDLAAVNGPRSVVISGDESRAMEIAAHFSAQGRRTARLAVSHAFHSPRLDPMLAELRAVAAGLTFRNPQIPIVSTLTGKPVGSDELASPDYWVRQARGTVDFAGALKALAAEGAGTFLELGPQGVLSALGPASLPDAAFVPTSRREQPEDAAVANALAQLHVRGVSIDWRAYFAPMGARRTALPTYPFQRRLHWLEEKPRAAALPGVEAAGHPLLGAAVPLATGGFVLTGRLALAAQPWLAGHAVFGTVILPGTAFLDLALAAARQAGAEGVEELIIEAPLVIPREGVVEIQLAIGPAADGRHTLAVHARSEGGSWTRHASGVLGAVAAKFAPAPWPPPDAEELPLEGLYERLEAAGLSYGEEFRRVRAAWRRGHELFVEVAGESGGYELNPMLLDAALHLLVREALEATALILPFSWTSVSLQRAGAPSLRVRIEKREGSGYALQVADGTGQPVAAIASLETRPAAAPGADHVYRVEWTRQPLPDRPATGSWALIGAEQPGLRARRFASVEELMRDRAVPNVIALHPAACASAAAVRATVKETLAALQTLLAEERFEKTTFALLTHEDVGGASAAGLLRSARSEYPSRTIAHVELDNDPRSVQALPRALAAGEPELALRGGAAWLPRLARARLASQPQRDLASGTVLITGGTGALGALVARHLVSVHGARNLLLVSRRGMQAPAAEALRSELEAAGACVTTSTCDVADADALKALLATIRPDRPLRGVVHAAGVLDDAVLSSIQPASIDRVLAPKVDAAWALDAVLRDQPLAFFALFSSVAGLIGPAGQGAYAAANAALDTLARRRRQEGQPAISIAFGPWQAGMAARLAGADEKRLARYGMSALSTEAALEALDAALGSEEPQVAVVALQSVAADDSGAVPALWRHLVTRPSRKPPPITIVPVKQELDALTPEERSGRIGVGVREELARLLGLPSAEEVPWEAAFRELGMDSLVAVELRNALARRFELTLPATLVFDYPNARAVTSLLTQRLAPPEPSTADVPGIDEMSEDQLDELLASLQNGTELQ